MAAISGYYVTFGLFSIILIMAVWYYRKLMKPYVGFPQYPVVSFLLYIYLCRKIPKDMSFSTFAFQKMIQLSKKYDHDGLVLVWLLGPTLFIGSEETVKIFSKDQECLDKPHKYDVLKDVFGTGLVTSSGERWRHKRKLLNPVFHIRMIKGKISIFNEYAEILVKNLEETIDKPFVDILDYLKQCSVGILYESLLGIKMNNQEGKKMIKNYVDRIAKLFQYTAFRISHPWLHFKFALYFTSSGRNFLKLYEENRKFTEKIILEVKDSVISKKSLVDDPLETDESRKSFVHILVEHHLKDPSFTLRDLRDEISTFMAAGFDTVSYTMMWTLYMLGLHEDVQEQVFNEVSSTETYLTSEDISGFEYLECVIKETLRLYPTVPIFGRILKREVQCGKYKVPKGTEIIFFPYNTHRNAEIYPDPEKFDPERFREEIVLKRPWMHIPFSEGIRHCIGKKFALMEMKVILAYILRNYKITSLDKRENVLLTWDGILNSSSPLRLQLRPRRTFAF